WSSAVCSSDLEGAHPRPHGRELGQDGGTGPGGVVGAGAFPGRWHGGSLCAGTDRPSRDLEDLVVAGDADAAPGERYAARGVRVGTVLELEVQVGLGGVAGVADLGEHLARTDPVALADGEGAAPEVGVAGVGAVAEVEDQVVADDPPGAQEVP